MATTRPAMLPAVKALIRNKLSWNIGSAILLSMTPNAMSRSRPPASRPITVGLAQPMLWPWYGWMPSVMPIRTAPRPTAKVTLPHQSMRALCRSPVSLSLR